MRRFGIKYSFFCQRYQRINTPTRRVTLKTENNFIEKGNIGSLEKKNAYIVIPLTCIRGVITELGNNSDSIARKLFPIKNIWYKKAKYQIVAVGFEKPRKSNRGNRISTLLINRDGKLPISIPQKETFEYGRRNIAEKADIRATAA